MDSLETIAFVGSIYMVVYIFLFQPGKVVGASMQPTLHTNERFVTDKVVYKLHPPERGDIVVLNSLEGTEVELIKRVIGLPGEHVSFREGSVYINGKKLDEPYTLSETYWYQEDKNEDANYSVEVPPETVFVLGDHREVSKDSRVFGPVPLENIVGRADFRYYPADKVGVLSP
jgi:signal peptidase I